MKTTRYYERRVHGDRPWIADEWVERVLKAPVRSEVQADRRIRHWGYVPEYGNRALRVVTLADGETVHNAFFDRRFRAER